MNDNLTNIDVKLAGRTYPVLADINDKEDIYQLNEQLNQEFDQLYKKYASKLNKQDILAMLLFKYAKKLLDTQQGSDSTNIKDRILSIENILDEALKQQS